MPKLQVTLSIDFDKEDYTDEDEKPLKGEDLKDAVLEALIDGSLGFDDSNVLSSEIMK